MSAEGRVIRLGLLGVCTLPIAFARCPWRRNTWPSHWTVTMYREIGMGFYLEQAEPEMRELAE
jgi:hypothetical protein